MPIVADVHFHYKRALEAVEAGIHKIRLNPGNINDRDQVNSVIDACRERGIPIRVGVNEGSIIERCKDKQQRAEELGRFFADRQHGHLLALMIAKLEEYMEIFEARDFHDVCIAFVDGCTPGDRHLHRDLEAVRLSAAPRGHPHAGPKETGAIRSVVALGTLLANGIGDTVQISYASDPVHEVEDALEMLYSLGLRTRKGAELIACPTCGQIQVDLFTLVQEVEAETRQ